MTMTIVDAVHYVKSLEYLKPIMKQSYYNVLVRKNENLLVLYNTLSQNMVALSNDEAAWLDNLDACPNAQFIEELAREDFIHENPEDECEWLKYQHMRYTQSDVVMDLTINPTQECNYHCSYCYVLKRDGFMSEEVQDKIFEFVRDQYKEAPFETLRVNWYGGEPLLGIDVMERLSGMLIPFCKSNKVEYLGHILSNASLADEAMIERLVNNCGITSVMPTLSGKGDMQDWQRPAKDGSFNYDKIMHNIDLMTKAGIIVLLNFVTNCNNCDGCLEVAGEQYGNHNTEIRLTETFPFENGAIKMMDKNRTPLRYFTPEEYGEYRVKFYRAMNLDAQGYRKVLEPLKIHCAAWLRRGFFIDDLGNVSSCMVDMEFPSERTMFNVLDWGTDKLEINWDRHVSLINLNPMDSSDCRQCEIYPLCKGQCSDHWLDPDTDKCINMLNWKYSLPQIVLDYYDAVVREESNWCC